MHNDIYINYFIYYIIIKIKVKNIETKYSYFTKQRMFYQDKFLNFYFIIKNKINNNINIGIEYYDKNELINKDYIFDKNNIIHEANGNIISKIIIANILNNTILNPEKKNRIIKLISSFIKINIIKCWSRK